jgi:hypothetical protein
MPHSGKKALKILHSKDLPRFTRKEAIFSLHFHHIAALLKA